MPSSPSPTDSSPASPAASANITAVAAAHENTTVTPKPTFPGLFPTRDGRRPSVQFAANASDSALLVASAAGKGLPTRPQRRMSSPPPPPTFQNRVSFDTFDNKDAVDFSLTLNSKHKDYVYTRRSRTFLCGTDQNDYSEFALEWLVEELVDDGDEIVCLRVVDKDSKISSDASVEEGRYRVEAKKLLDKIIEKNTDGKAISIILEFAVGKVQDTIQRMIRIYEPVILVVGTRGRSLGGLQGLLPGSVSKYCLQHSPVPVIVVRPTSKREKKKKKRQADPSRRGYLDILEKSGGVEAGKPGHVLDRGSRNSLTDEFPPPNEAEAQAVAEAVGLPSGLEEALHKIQIAQAGKGDIIDAPDFPSRVQSPLESPTTTEDPKSPGVVMKSPTLDNLESPDSSESEDDDKTEFEVHSGGQLLRDKEDGETDLPLGKVASDESIGSADSVESSVSTTSEEGGGGGGQKKAA